MEKEDLNVNLYIYYYKSRRYDVYLKSLPKKKKGGAPKKKKWFFYYLFFFMYY